jgi:two-component system response regulator
MNSHDNVILMVEDNADFVELAQRAFVKSNILNPLVVAEDGAEALDYLFGTGAWAERPHGNPVLILLDLKLPKVDGLEVLRRLRDDPRTRLVPVVILTTSLEEQDIAAGYKLGANSYIRKPVDFTQLAEVLKHMGLYWLVINQPPVAQGG